jgi:hypothetical protein
LCAHFFADGIPRAAQLSSAGSSHMSSEACCFGFIFLGRVLGNVRWGPKGDLAPCRYNVRYAGNNGNRPH